MEDVNLPGQNKFLINRSQSTAMKEEKATQFR